ncbi:MAG: hypothetical protein HYX41_05175 [Bdellovibrio sp.]|nr:hypothetical protein [Bdellovibrio sp.]
MAVAENRRKTQLNGPGQRKGESGQAVVEYILLTAIVVTFFMTLTKGLGKMGLGKLLTKPLKTTFAMAYKYGDTRAKGFDEGSPRYHPRVVGGEGNLRIFILPEPD